jgi:putative endonuclease
MCEHGPRAWNWSEIRLHSADETDPSRHYVGRASNVDDRLDWHNAGPSGYTVHHRPWSVVVIVEFPDEGAAVRFERYLKSGSGRAFAKRHF